MLTAGATYNSQNTAYNLGLGYTSNSSSTMGQNNAVVHLIFFEVMDLFSELYIHTYILTQFEHSQATRSPSVAFLRFHLSDRESERGTPAGRVGEKQASP